MTDSLSSNRSSNTINYTNPQTYLNLNNDQTLNTFVTLQCSKINKLINEINGNSLEMSQDGKEFSSLSIQCKAVIEAIMSSFDTYFCRFIRVIHDQLQHLVESWKYQKKKYDRRFTSNDVFNNSHNLEDKNSMTFIKNPHKLNFFVSKHLKIHKERLHDELKNNFEAIKQALAECVNKKSVENEVSELDLYECIDIKYLLETLTKKINHCETIGLSLIENTKKFHDRLFSEPSIFEESKENSECNYEKYTDFSSDTETSAALRSASFNDDFLVNLLNKWQLSQGKKIELVENIKKKGSQNNNRINEKLARNKWNYSESELDKMTVPDFSQSNDMESFTSADYEMYQQKRYRSSKRKNHKEGSNYAKKKSIGNRQFDNINPDSYEYDRVYNDDVSPSASIYTLTDDLSSNGTFASDNEEENLIVNIETISQTSKIQEIQNKKKENELESHVSDSDSDCIVLDNNDTQETNLKASNYCEYIYDKKRFKVYHHIKLGMRVFGLKNKEKHLWRIGKIIRVIEEKKDELKKPDLSIGNLYKTNLKFVVHFEHDDEDIYNDEQFLDEFIESKDATSNKLLEDNSDEIELDSSCIAFLDTDDEKIPDLPYISYDDTNKVMILPIHMRVVSLLSLSIGEGDTVINSEYFSSGTIAEVPSKQNQMRYLVFFDNGYSMYTNTKHVFPIFNFNTVPLDRLNMDHTYFLNNYFNLYPERILVRLQVGDFVDFYCENKWYNCQVTDVDSALVKLDFHESLFEKVEKFNNQESVKSRKNEKAKFKHKIWVYRGSYRLRPLCSQILASIHNFKDKKKQTLSTYERYIMDKIDMKDVYKINGSMNVFASTLFPKFVDFNNIEVIGYFDKGKLKQIKGKKKMDIKQQREKQREEKKARQLEEKLRREEEEERVTQGKSRFLDLESIYPSKEKVKFVKHPCLAHCVAKWEKDLEFVRYVNPLLMPFLHGWKRLICHQIQTISTVSRKWINYETPCGRIVRNTGEVEKYLNMTNSKLTIDQFTFDQNIQTSREYEANASYLKIEDITNGKETVPISAVNCLDETKPDEIEYEADRVPLEGVPLNISQENLHGCDCTDGCRDRTKCACWRKTFEATEFTNHCPKNTNLGYRGRRLPEIVRTGIFECNSNCKCDSRCGNRVVQNGISVRLQLFKTHKKGWGLRCLDDIAKGAFICIYAGHLMTEEQSDTRGIEFGDEYFAELDFVECIRKFSEYDEMMNGSSESGSGSEENVTVNKKKKKPSIDLNSSSYQRPKSVLPKRHVIESAPDCIFLDSDEDEQDREERSVSLVPKIESNTVNYNKSRILSYQNKIQKMSGAIDSNRFFTDPFNRYYYRNFMEDNSVFIMDAKIQGNIGRFFNHSCSPNLFVQNVFVDTYDLRFPWIAFFSCENINAGTELCWDYNYTIDSVQGRKLFCHCMARNCRKRLL